MNRPLLLPGCSPTPLAHYLKALGVLRLVSEQLPSGTPHPRGAWQGESFVLHTTLDRVGLERFFLHEYRPTPILAPWNGGSGFYASDNCVAVKALKNSSTDRFTSFKTEIQTARSVLAQHLGRIRHSVAYREALKQPAGKKRQDTIDKTFQDTKAHLLLACRGRMHDCALEWLDAALVITSDGPKFPPLLGTGGNDGRLEFTNNFMQRLVDIFEIATGQPSLNSAALLSGSLFAEPTRGLADNAIGQFFPDAAGGANSSSGFDAKSLVNPWDFVLMLEGALLFGAASVKRLETDRANLPIHSACTRAALATRAPVRRTPSRAANCGHRSGSARPLWRS
jgi:CRISPR-associated protein Csx17